jgi:hypothetical protein
MLYIKKSIADEFDYMVEFLTTFSKGATCFFYTWFCNHLLKEIKGFREQEDVWEIAIYITTTEWVWGYRKDDFLHKKKSCAGDSIIFTPISGICQNGTVRKDIYVCRSTGIARHNTDMRLACLRQQTADFAGFCLYCCYAVVVQNGIVAIKTAPARIVGVLALIVWLRSSFHM